MVLLYHILSDLSTPFLKKIGFFSICIFVQKSAALDRPICAIRCGGACVLYPFSALKRAALPGYPMLTPIDRVFGVG